MEQLILLLVFGAAAAFQHWLKNRDGGSDASDLEDLPPVKGSRGSSGTSDWEDELRRLLEGEQPITKSKAPPPLPAPRSAPASPAPRRSLPPEPVVISHTWKLPQSVVMEDGEGPEVLSVARLRDASEAHERVARLQQRTAERLNQVSAAHEHTYKTQCSHCEGRIEFPLSGIGSNISCPHCGRETRLLIREMDKHLSYTTAHRNRRTPEAGQAIGMLNNRQSLRQAVIASVILAPPRALQPLE